MDVRKQVYNLTIADMADFPVWEFALDEEEVEGQDEATVRPYVFTPPLDPRDGMFAVRAEFFLADGTSATGYLTPQPAVDLSSIQPIVIAGDKQIGFWSGMRVPTREEISSHYEALGKSSKQVFPIRFRSVVELVGGNIEGSIDGFQYLSDDRIVETTR